MDDSLAGTARPPVRLVTRPPAWLGGGAYMQQLADTVRRYGDPGDHVLQVTSLRGGGDADRRLPGGLLARLGPRTLRAAGAALWGSGCVHRVSADLPPARRELVTVMDLAPFHHDDEGVAPRHLLDQLRRAEGVVTLTEVIAEELRADLGVERVWLVPPALGERFLADAPADDGAGRGAPYVLHLGGATRRKGLDRLAAAWPQVAALGGLRLVMAGPPHPHGRAALTGRPDVDWRGLSSDEDALALLRGARALVVPSTYEGFGMPVAEAMAVGTPVVVLAGTAPAEVGADVAFAADPAGGADALAEQVLAAASARDDQPGRLARGRVVALERFAPAVTTALQLDAYRDAFG